MAYNAYGTGISACRGTRVVNAPDPAGLRTAI
jgi:hypothetical protein